MELNLESNVTQTNISGIDSSIASISLSQKQKHTFISLQEIQIFFHSDHIYNDSNMKDVILILYSTLILAENDESCEDFSCVCRHIDAIVAAYLEIALPLGLVLKVIGELVKNDMNCMKLGNVCLHVASALMMFNYSTLMISICARTIKKLVNSNINPIQIYAVCPHLPCLLNIHIEDETTVYLILDVILELTQKDPICRELICVSPIIPIIRLIYSDNVIILNKMLQVAKQIII